MSYMKCGICESWERCAECGWCVFCAESEKAKLLSEIERLRRVEQAAHRLVMCGHGVEDEMDYYTTLCAHRDMLKAALEEK